MTMPTSDEVLARIRERKPDDVFGFEWSEYVDFLEYEHAKEFLKPEVTAEHWAEARKPLTRESVLAVMLEYMPFAWEKANDKRGLSASRSIMHYVAWTWLAGDHALSEWLDTEYEFYGKPQLVRICETYGWDAKQWDDGVRENS